MPTRVAVLDDYQAVALSHPAWRELSDEVEVVAFHDHLDDPASLVRRLSDFSVVVLMRSSPVSVPVTRRVGVCRVRWRR